MISALARFARPLPVLPASLALVAGLAGGLVRAGLGHRHAGAGAGDFRRPCRDRRGAQRHRHHAGSGGRRPDRFGLAFMEQGARGGLLLFCAAALVGLCQASAFAVQQAARCAEKPRGRKQLSTDTFSRGSGITWPSNWATKAGTSRGASQNGSKTGRVIATHQLDLKRRHAEFFAFRRRRLVSRAARRWKHWPFRWRAAASPRLLSLRLCLSQREQSRACPVTTQAQGHQDKRLLTMPDFRFLKSAPPYSMTTKGQRNRTRGWWLC